MTLLSADTIGTRTARLRGEVNPHGQPVASYFFEYGPNGSLASTTTPQQIPDETVPREVRETLATSSEHDLHSPDRNRSNDQPSPQQDTTTPRSRTTTRTASRRTDRCNSDDSRLDAIVIGCFNDNDDDAILDKNDRLQTTHQRSRSTRTATSTNDSDGDGSR